MRLKQKTLHGFLSLYDGCVQALPTQIVVKSYYMTPFREHLPPSSPICTI